ncbi:hypothetical protein Rhal01_02367 [Rubritalea halochordaticola]|uniref:HTH gntR-type domain-containing protein n=1 Tax=Rubritalea halochordaticola TaxID=714537 RepID=A0ABP9V0N9_9BACT
MAKLNKKSLPQQVADAMEQDIIKGVWKGTLPGYRILLARYEVSKVTCVRAISLLERKGLVSKAEPRKKRAILVTPEISQAMTDLGTLLIIVDISEAYIVESQENISVASHVWRERGGHVVVKEVDLTRNRAPNDLMKRWASENPVSAIFMIMPPREWVLAAYETEIPIFRIGGWLGEGDVKGTILAYLATDVWGDTLAYLRSMGHERILVPWKFSNKFVWQGVLDAYRASHSDCLSLEEIEALVPLVDHRNAEDWHQCWSGLLTRTQPTAVAITKPLEAISLMMFCAKAGIKVPDHLSILLVNPSDLSLWISPRLTSMEEERHFSSGTFAKWVDGGLLDKGLISVPKILVEGESVKNLNS